MVERGNLENIWRTLLSKLGLDRSYRKVFAIGFNKTATTSIHSVFTGCGLTAAHSILWRDSRHPLVHWPYQAFSDGIPNDFTRLDQRFPNSRFILNTRDLTEWLDSRLEHIAKAQAAGRPTWKNWQKTEAAIVRWVHRRNEHHAKVLRYFADRPQDLLVVNFIRDPQAASRIAAFIGKDPPPERPYTHSLRTGRRQGELSNRELIESALTSEAIPPADWSNDLFCPSLGAVDDLPPDTSAFTSAQ
ncbi:MAG: sulfotransferase [Devosia sp.]